MFCRDDDFIIESPALGTLRKIVVSHINTNNYAWFLESVVVTDLETRLVYRFPCRCWISLQAGWARQILVNNADNLGLALHVSFGYRIVIIIIIIILGYLLKQNMSIKLAVQ